MHLWAVHTYFLQVSTDPVAIAQNTKIENSWVWDSASKMYVQTAWLMTQSLALTYLKPGNHSNLWHWLQSVKWLLYIIAAPLCSIFCAVLGWCEWIYKLSDINPQKGGSLTTLILWSKLLLFFFCLGPFLRPIWTLHCSLWPECTPTLPSWQSYNAVWVWCKEQPGRGRKPTEPRFWGIKQKNWAAQSVKKVYFRFLSLQNTHQLPGITKERKDMIFSSLYFHSFLWV